MSTNPEYSPTMNPQALLQFREARDAAINGRLSAVVDQAARDGTNGAPPQGMINPLGQAASVRSPVEPNRVHPVYRTRRPHHGTDFVPSSGSAESPVVAAADGYVLYVGAYSRDAGQTVLLYHPNGPDGPYITGYMHLKVGSLTTRELGSRVAQGERLGDMGETGVGTGPHLHFVVRKLNPQPQDMPLIENSPSRTIDDGGAVPVAMELSDPARNFTSYTVVRPTINGVLYRSTGQNVAWVPPQVAPTSPLKSSAAAMSVAGLPSHVSGGEDCDGPIAPCRIPQSHEPMQR